MSHLHHGQTQQEVRGYKRYASRAIHVHDVIVTDVIVWLEKILFMCCVQ